MPMFMDRHDLEDASTDAVAQAHVQDLQVQDKHNVRYLSYWFDYERQHAFCLVEAPNAEAAEAVHREAHGLLAHNIVEVQPDRVHEFLGAPPSAPPGEPYEAVAFRTILFTDIVGSTALNQRLGDAQAMILLRRHNEIVRQGLARFSGREVKHTGDGIMASFMSAARGVECAIWIQQRLAASDDAGSGTGLKVRIGLAAGEPVAEDNDLFGAAVQLAARLCGRAEPGGILVSIGVRELCSGRQFSFSKPHSHELRGFDQPVPAHSVAWDCGPGTGSQESG